MKNPAKKNEAIKYAIAVQDGKSLLLWGVVCRSPQGDVYTNYDSNDLKKGPHTSIHASGEVHDKGGWPIGIDPSQKRGKAEMMDSPEMLKRRNLGQKTEGNFKGIGCGTPISIYPQMVKSFNIPCRSNDFSGVAKIPVHLLKEMPCASKIVVDITEPGCEGDLMPKEKILHQTIFKDLVPWIVVTLFE